MTAATSDPHAGSRPSPDEKYPAGDKKREIPLLDESGAPTPVHRDRTGRLAPAHFARRIFPAA